MQICVDARLIGGTVGGVQQVIIGLAKGLAELEGHETYSFLAYPESSDWLRPYLTGPCKLLLTPKGIAPPAPSPHKQKFSILQPVLQQLWHQLKLMIGQRVINIPKSDGTIEQAGMEVIHFTHQSAFLTNLPSLYHPHDLQHVHLPQFFKPIQRLGREVYYKTFCHQAHYVIVASAWVKQDITQHYQITQNKVKIVTWPPATMAYVPPAAADLAVVKQKFQLPESFIFYPAQTWPHKNHLGLLKALTILRDKYNLTIPFVSSGHQTEFFPQIEQYLKQQNLTQQVYFLGFISPLELQCLYKLCRLVAIPSMFEAASFPLWEAFLAETPVVCSNVTSLPDLAGDAALLFNPNQPLEIAEAIYRLWTDPTLRQTLVTKGKQIVTQFSWEKTARIFRAYYRHLAHRPLTEEDNDLLLINH